MASRIDIFSIYSVRSDLHLLLRVERRESRNSDETDCNAAIDEAYQRRHRLLQEALDALDLPASSDTQLIGELQDIPVGDLLFDAAHGSELDIWVAPTRFGAPWVVLGTAPNEQTFWNEIADDPDLSVLDPRQPATLLRVHYFTDRAFSS